jgi:hypothetical protein
MPATDPRTQQAATILAREHDTWTRAYLTRKALGLQSAVAVVTAGSGIVAVVSPAEAAERLRELGSPDDAAAVEAKGSAPPGTCWGLAIADGGHMTWLIDVSKALGL